MLTAADLNAPDSVDALLASVWEQLPSLEDFEGGIGGACARGKVKAFAEERVRGVLAARSLAVCDVVGSWLAHS